MIFVIGGLTVRMTLKHTENNGNALSPIRLKGYWGIDKGRFLEGEAAFTLSI